MYVLSVHCVAFQLQKHTSKQPQSYFINITSYVYFIICRSGSVLANYVVPTV